jgi:hypothetical protein
VSCESGLFLRELASVQGPSMNESVARAAAQAKFVWKTEDLYGRRRDGATDSFMGGPCSAASNNLEMRTTTGGGYEQIGINSSDENQT